MALKLTLSSPPIWPDFLTYSLSTLQAQGTNREILLEFMTIAVEEVQRAPKAPKYVSAVPFLLTTYSVIQ